MRTKFEYWTFLISQTFLIPYDIQIYRQKDLPTYPRFKKLGMISYIKSANFRAIRMQQN